MENPSEGLSRGYGERVVSWMTILDELASADDYDRTAYRQDEADARELHRLRGLALSQASETESVLGQALHILDSTTRRDRPAGILLQELLKRIPPELWSECEPAVASLKAVVRRRNRLAHDAIEIGYTFVGQPGYAVQEPVIALLGQQDVDESFLRGELATQQRGTRTAVKMLLAFQSWRWPRDLAKADGAEAEK